MSTPMGRSWPGMGNPLERDCPCPKEPCGLVDQEKANPDCMEHPMRRRKTMRQGHPAGECPGRPPVLAPGPPPDMVVGDDGELYAMDLLGDTGRRVASFTVGGLVLSADCLPGLKRGDLVQVQQTALRWKVVRVRHSWWRRRAVSTTLLDWLDMDRL